MTPTTTKKPKQTKGTENIPNQPTNHQQQQKKPQQNQPEAHETRFFFLSLLPLPEIRNPYLSSFFYYDTQSLSDLTSDAEGNF